MLLRDQDIEATYLILLDREDSFLLRSSIVLDLQSMTSRTTLGVWIVMPYVQILALEGVSTLV